MNIKITLDELLEILQYAGQKGYNGKSRLLLNIEPGQELTIDQTKSIIDDAVRMQKNHEENLAHASFPDPGDQIPMTQEQRDHLISYVGGTGVKSSPEVILLGENLNDMSFGQAKAKIDEKLKQSGFHIPSIEVSQATTKLFQQMEDEGYHPT